MKNRTDVCPLCGGENHCEAERSAKASDCWCFHEPMPAELLARIPEQSRGKACICRSCAKAFNSGNDQQDQAPR